MKTFIMVLASIFSGGMVGYSLCWNMLAADVGHNARTYAKVMNDMNARVMNLEEGLCPRDPWSRRP